MLETAKYFLVNCDLQNLVEHVLFYVLHLAYGISFQSM